MEEKDLVTTKLPLWNRLYPGNSNVHANSNDTDDPEYLWEITDTALDSCEAEDDGEDLRQKN